MKIKVHAQLIWKDRVFWLVSEKPRFVENRLNHDRYDVVPWNPDLEALHSYIRFIDVPKGNYIVMGTEEHEIAIKE